MNFIHQVYKRLKKEFGPVSCPLHYKEPYQLAIAVILSAQCTDERVNLVTPVLFSRFKTARELAEAPLKEIEACIFSTGFYKNKAKNIKGFCKEYCYKYKNTIPEKIEVLITMPGVGRKTANVILQEIYHLVQGLVVDTHVVRISNIFRLTQSKAPIVIERDLMGKIPKKYWLEWSLFMIFLGRKYCIANRPKCDICVLNDICPKNLGKG